MRATTKFEVEIGPKMKFLIIQEAPGCYATTVSVAKTKLDPDDERPNRAVKTKFDCEDELRPTKTKFGHEETIRP